MSPNLGIKPGTTGPAGTCWQWGCGGQDHDVWLIFWKSTMQQIGCLSLSLGSPWVLFPHFPTLPLKDCVAPHSQFGVLHMMSTLLKIVKEVPGTAIPRCSGFCGSDSTESASRTLNWSGSKIQSGKYNLLPVFLPWKILWLRSLGGLAVHRSQRADTYWMTDTLTSQAFILSLMMCDKAQLPLPTVTLYSLTDTCKPP